VSESRRASASKRSFLRGPERARRVGHGHRHVGEPKEERRQGRVILLRELDRALEMAERSDR